MASLIVMSNAYSPTRPVAKIGKCPPPSICRRVQPLKQVKYLARVPPFSCEQISVSVNSWIHVS